MTAFTLTVIFFLLQQFRLFSFFGINPNLVFVALLFFVFRGILMRHLIILLAVIGVLAAAFVPVWILHFAALFITVFVFKFIKDFMTGSRMLDLLVGIFLGTFVFYFLAGFFEFGFPLALMFKEAVYNVLVGAIIWLILPEKNA